MFSPLIAFLIAGLASPGPNVIMLTSSGARFGARATWPHLVGVVIGTGIIGGVCGLGIGALILSQPQLRFTLQCISAAWILWMAYRMLFPRKSASQKAIERPMTFFEAAVFQWVNPKIWAVALAAASGYSIGLTPMGEAIRIAAGFSSVNLFVCVFWTYSGALLAALLNNETRWFYFRCVMAILLALSAILVFL
ncbi:LysE family translocator [Amylibacter sp. IMCC11727]|uniref:LysE family translocator n=1 Tax=Amylibacter sp. IMCC11727 TaxID=3039851 RepID=UPI00244DDA0F|nr:LysE family translocator [Amylibacter sp. IMCC11727]WGI21949.1 LysE family translocator [Amylibacter sp. IMCC11727]